MKFSKINAKLGLAATFATGAILVSLFSSIAMADPAKHCNDKAMSTQQIRQQMQERIKTRMDRLAQRLEIKASQQQVWEDFAKSIESLPDWNAKRPGDDADAATIARYRADRAAEMAGKLTKVADATAKLQSALSEDQRKILNQTAQLILHRDHRFGRMHHDPDHRGMDRRDPHSAS